MNKTRWSKAETRILEQYWSPHLAMTTALPDPVSGRCRRPTWRWAALIFTVTAWGQTAVSTPAVATSGREPGTVFRDCPDCPEMVVVPAGNFTMGSSASEKSWAASHGGNMESVSDESPQHVVSLRWGAFVLNRYLLTSWVRPKQALLSGMTCEGMPLPPT